MPVETTAEKPISFISAQSRMAVQMAPDCETSARLPGFATLWPKVMLRFLSGRIRPRQLGPIKRIPWRSTRSVTRFSSFLPSSPISRKPADRINIILMLCSPQASTIAGMVLAGVATTARSICSPISVRVAYAFSPCTVSCLGFIAKILPSKPAESRFRNTTPPTEFSLSLAPKSAILFGVNKDVR